MNEVDPQGNPLNIADDRDLVDGANAYWGFVIQDSQSQFFNKAAVRQPSDNKFFKQHEFDWYGQDTWKIRSNFTLNLGLRYQLNGVPYETSGNLSNLLQDPGTFAAGQPLTFSIVGPGSGHQLYNSDYKDIEPRFGFSWDPWKDGKTAIRGGFGIFHDRTFGNVFGNVRADPPFPDHVFQLYLRHLQRPLRCNHPGNKYTRVSGTTTDPAGFRFHRGRKRHTEHCSFQHSLSQRSQQQLEPRCSAAVTRQQRTRCCLRRRDGRARLRAARRQPPRSQSSSAVSRILRAWQSGQSGISLVSSPPRIHWDNAPLPLSAAQICTRVCNLVICPSTQ